MSEPTESTEEPGHGVFGAYPKQGVGATAKNVAEDVRALVQAEVALAKAEVINAVRSKAVGAAMFAVAGVLGLVALLALLLAAGFALAEIGGLPGWASALIVAGALLVLAAILALVGRAKLKAQISTEVTRANVEKDVAWVKDRLPSKP